MKHLKLYLMYYSQSFEDNTMFEKMEHQHHETMKYLNRMLLSIPNSMRRYIYMKNAVENMDLILRNYNQKIADKFNITYVSV